MRRPTRLSASFVRTVKHPGRYGDGYGGHGLSLLVKATRRGPLSKTWSQKLRIDGKPFMIGMGVYPVVTLAEARAKALENRRAVAQGRDPRRPGVPTFEAATESVIRLRRPTWKPGGRSEQQWRSAFTEHVFPILGAKRVSEVTSGHLLGLLTADDLWNSRRATARRLLQWLGVVFRWSIAEGHRGDNPVDAIRAALPSNATRVKHQRAIHHREVSDAIRKVRGSTSQAATRLCFEWLVLTACRSREAREARWEEVSGGTWTIPAPRTKSDRQHRVPLSSAALRVLDEARGLSDGSGLIFPGTIRGRPVGEKTLSAMVRGAGVDAVPHGFRTSFRTWCGDTGVAREVAEAALGHVIKNQAEAAYARSDLLDRRREIMARWGRYVDG